MPRRCVIALPGNRYRRDPSGAGGRPRMGGCVPGVIHGKCCEDARKYTDAEAAPAPPKTQSALLECMEERQVTVDGTTYELQAPFMVIATQNPIEMEGTYPLPEAQRDRFTARLAMGYPDPRSEILMLTEHTKVDPLESLRPVSDAAEMRGLIATVRNVHVSEAVQQYAVDLVTATRNAPDL